MQDGSGDNYSIQTSVSVGDELTVAIKTAAGSDPSTGDEAVFNVGGVDIELDSALSVTLGEQDFFAWDAGKIQGNDAQLFVYIIDNDGTPAIGVSPSPALRTVATNYYDGSQTGSAGHHNIVMDSARETTNLCRVIARVNVHQEDDDDWRAPVVSQVVNRPIFHTDWLEYETQRSVSGGTTPTYTQIDKSLYRVFDDTVELELHWANISGGTAGSGSSQLEYTIPVVPAESAITNSLMVASGFAVESAGFSHAVVSRYLTGNSATIRRCDSMSTILSGDDQGTSTRKVAMQGRYRV